jgi:hypothetical protein
MKSHKKEKGQTKHKNSPSKTSTNITKKDEEDPLKKAILALGGDEEDYALIQDVSDIEHEKNTKDVSFQSSLYHYNYGIYLFP